MSEQRTAAEVRELARAVTPAMSLDPEWVLALGRRRRRRGRALTGGGVLAGACLVLAATIAVGGTPWGPGLPQRPGGDLTPGTSPATVVTLAGGLEAVVGPVVPDGFQADLGTLAGARVVLDRFTRLANTDPEIVQLAAFVGADYVVGQPQDLVLGDGYGEIVATLPAGGRVLVGAVPSGFDGAVHATLTGDDGGLRQVIDVPTFTFEVPGTDAPERLFIALGFDPDRAGDVVVELRPVEDHAG